MPKVLVIGLIISLLIIGLGGLYLLKSGSNNTCQVFDGNQQACLSHPECKWNSGMNCDSTDTIEKDNEGLIQKLEDIAVPNNPSNAICKTIPLSNQPSYGMRYYCLAIVNHDERFCEGIDEEKEKITCLAHAKKDSSYCQQQSKESAKHLCYFMLAVSSNNGDFCSDITYSQHEREQCYFSFMSNLYQWGKSDKIKTEHCSQLGPPGNQMRNTCLALKAKDISMCGNDPNCLTFFKQPLSFCDEASDKVSCIKDRAKTSKDVSICELLPQPDRDICVGVYCTHTELDVKICSTIENINKRQEMLVELAMNLGNW